MKILVIDDHVLIRQAMHGVLRKLKRDVIVLDAPNGRVAMQTIADHLDIDLVLLDLTLPDRDGLSVLEDIRERCPAVPVVVLSAVQDPGNVTRALDLGARGFIPKSAQGDVLLNALRLVVAGGTYVPPEILAGAARPSPSPRPPKGERSGTARADIGLTDRQLEVLALMMQGKNNKTICRKLHLAEPTVKNHVTAILKTLKVTNRTEAVIKVGNMGWEPFPTTGS